MSKYLGRSPRECAVLLFLQEALPIGVLHGNLTTEQKSHRRVLLMLDGNFQ